MERPPLALQHISPTVLRCSHLADFKRYPPGHRFQRRPIADYEIEFFEQSEGSVFLNEEEHPIRAGDLLFKRPGMTNQGVAPYQAYLVCFDLTGTTQRDPRSFDLFAPHPTQPNYQNSWLDEIPLLTRPVAPETFQSLFELLAREFLSDEPSMLLMRATLLQILHHLHQEALQSLTPTLSPSSPYYTRLTEVINVIQGHLASNLTLAGLAEVAAMDRFHFHKVFVRHFHQTPVQYVTRLRLQRAKDLLMHSSLSLAEVAVTCGVPHVPYFGKLFLRQVGITPGEYRKRHRYR